MRKVNLSTVRQGRTLIFVHALGSASYLETVFVTGKPFVLKLTGSICIPVKRISVIDGTTYDSVYSALDMNIIPNKYNNHRAFFSRKKALNYLEYCLKQRRPAYMHVSRKKFNPMMCVGDLT